MQKAKTDMTCGYNISEWESADVSANYLHDPEWIHKRKKKIVAHHARRFRRATERLAPLTPPWARKANALFEELLNQSIPCDLHNRANIVSVLSESLSAPVWLISGIQQWTVALDSSLSGDGGEMLTFLQPAWGGPNLNLGLVFFN